MQDTSGDEKIDKEVLEAFGEQITVMSDDYSFQNSFSSPRFKDGEQVSTVYWSLCQPLGGDGEEVGAGCGPQASCCEVFSATKRRTCGLYTSPESAMFEFDRYLRFQKDGVSLVAGITLKYNSSGATVPSNAFGLPGRPGNPMMPLCFVMDLKCDPLTSYFQMPQIDAIYDGDAVCMRARIESQHGCVAATGKFLHMTSWKILFYILAPAAMVAGLMLCFLGWRLFRITSLVLGLFFGLSVAGIVVIIAVFFTCEATKPDRIGDFWNWSHECTFHYLTANPYVGWIASISGLIFGLALAIAAYRKPTFGGVLIGMTVGAWLSDFLYATTFSVLKQHWIVLVLSSLFIPLFGLLGGCLPNSWKRAFFIITIACTGGYLFCWGIGAYTMYFPSITLPQEPGPKWQYIIFAIVIVIFAIIGSLVQFFITGNFDWDTLMESGLCPRNSKRRGAGSKQGAESLLSAADQDVEMDEKTKNIISEINSVEN